MEEVTVLHRLEGLHGKDVVILFGKTRAGKSTFINDAYRRKVVKSTTSLTSDTDEISYVSLPIRVDNHDVFLVDTIGLGGSGEYHDRASFALKWLRILHPGPRDRKSPLQPTVKGILYFIDIMDAAINEDNIRNLQTFKALVGEDVLESVVFVTAKWAPKEEIMWRRRLEINFIEWQQKIRADFPGASILRLDDTTGRLDEETLDNLPPKERQTKAGEYHENAMRVLRQLLQKQATQPVLAEREMYAGGKAMKAGQTTLGQTTIRHLFQDIERSGGTKTMKQDLKPLIQSIKDTVMLEEPSLIKNKGSKRRFFSSLFKRW